MFVQESQLRKSTRPRPALPRSLHIDPRSPSTRRQRVCSTLWRPAYAVAVTCIVLSIGCFAWSLEKKYWETFYGHDTYCLYVEKYWNSEYTESDMANAIISHRPTSGMHEKAKKFLLDGLPHWTQALANQLAKGKTSKTEGNDEPSYALFTTNRNWLRHWPSTPKLQATVRKWMEAAWRAHADDDAFLERAVARYERFVALSAAAKGGLAPPIDVDLGT